MSPSCPFGDRKSPILLGNVAISGVTTYRTAPARAGDSLVERQALEWLRCFRCLTTAQLDEFLHDPAIGTAEGREKATRRLLQRLARNGLVGASRRLVGGPGGGSARLTYQLTESGHALLGARDGSRTRSRAFAGTTTIVEHRLMTADVALAFVRSARAHAGHHVVAWEPDREATELMGETELVPDGRVVYATPEWELSAFVEVDLGTERPIRFADKIRRYVEALRGGQWRSRLVAWPMVLTVCRTEERATALRRTTEDVIDQEGVDASESEFLFGANGALEGRAAGSRGPLGPVWQIAGRDGRHALIADRVGASAVGSLPAPGGTLP